MILLQTNLRRFSIGLLLIPHMCWADVSLMGAGLLGGEYREPDGGSSFSIEPTMQLMLAFEFAAIPNRRSARPYHGVMLAWSDTYLNTEADRTPLGIGLIHLTASRRMAVSPDEESYVHAGAGATVISPEADHLHYRPSISIATGYLRHLSSVWDLRVEARFITNVWDGETQIRCGEGCQIHIEAGSWDQLTLGIGLNARF